ncbi:hypothetical protein P5673_023618 [Acropora cervicornis]|uniref:Uncharacterized protein n=1 Tax=Acropora cervicornis TaxID=6130 RepID=A0AAD9Q544_ACRCE|nr:hypothetical protein P5673_023618 [Acropora cervicornis]
MPGREYNAHQTKRLTYRCTSLWAGDKCGVRIKDLSSLTIEQIMRAKRHDFIALESYNTVFKFLPHARICEISSLNAPGRKKAVIYSISGCWFGLEILLDRRTVLSTEGGVTIGVDGGAGSVTGLASWPLVVTALLKFLTLSASAVLTSDETLTSIQFEKHRPVSLGVVFQTPLLSAYPARANALKTHGFLSSTYLTLHHAERRDVMLFHVDSGLFLALPMTMNQTDLSLECHGKLVQRLCAPEPLK